MSGPWSLCLPWGTHLCIGVELHLHSSDGMSALVQNYIPFYRMQVYLNFWLHLVTLNLTYRIQGMHLKISHPLAHYRNL